MSLLSKTKIKTKFLISPVILIILLIITVPFVLHNITKQYEVISQFSKIGLSSSQELSLLFKEIQYHNYKFDRFINHSNLVRGAEGNAENGSQVGLEKEKKGFQDTLNQLITNFDNLTKKYFKGSTYQKDIRELKTSFERYKKSSQSVLDNIGQDRTALIEHLSFMNRHYTALKQQMDDLTSKIKIETQLSINEIQLKAANQMKIFLIVLGIAIFVTLVVGVLFSTYLTHPISQLASTIQDITRSGDYSQRAKKETQCEIGHLVDGFNQMLFEIQRTEKSLIDARENLSNILESLQQMIIVTNEKGLIKEVNRKAMKVLGYKNKKDIKNKFIEHILGEDSRDGFKEISFNDLISRDMSQFSVKNYLGSNNESVKVMFSCSIIRDESQRVTGVVCVSYPV